MKNTSRLLPCLAAVCAAAGLSLNAAPLAVNTPVHASPDAASAVIVTLAAGADPQLTSLAAADAPPAGWQAVDVTVTNDVWVRDSDLNKELDVKPGTPLLTEPQADANIYGVMALGDATELRGMQGGGKWVQMRVTQKRVGYINVSAVSTIAADTAPKKQDAQQQQQQQQSTPPAGAPAPEFLDSGVVAAPPAPAHAAQPPPLPQRPAASAPATTQPAAPASAQPPARPAVEAKPAPSAALPRSFEGVFASTRRAFAPRRPYEYQLTDPSGTRYAYLDLSTLLTTQQFENFVGHTVIVYGTMAAVPNSRDIVIKVETMQLK